jgi:hypothetical protein
VLVPDAKLVKVLPAGLRQERRRRCAPVVHWVHARVPPL